ncbi:hypothetical protein D3C76_1190240 [compost metagenome]
MAGDTRTGLGITMSLTSPRPIARPALSRKNSRRCMNALSASNSAGLSSPRLPSWLASTISIGIAMSMHVTAMPSIMSRGCPVGKSFPVLLPAASRKVSCTGAAVPGTPSMAVSPS